MGQVVDLAGRRGLVAAAGEPAVLVPQDDRPADRGRDVAADPDVQGEAGAGEAGAELPAAQEPGQPARPGQQVDGLADDGLLEGLPDADGARVRRGRAAAVTGGANPAVVVADLVELDAQPDQLIQRGRVDLAGDDGGQRGVTSERAGGVAVQLRPAVAAAAC